MVMKSLCGLLQLLVMVALLQALLSEEALAAAADDGNDSHQQQQSIMNILYSILGHLFTTLETWIRAFSFGFGLHLLLYIFSKPNVTSEELKQRMNVSFICGIAFGCFCFGGSMIFPAHIRQQWWESA
mmetsp:Transcript_48408/g.117188  ORF Transcript_48408/g.117188 Transcript_48408/m.117188 type:complete len:128 (+) Transcript_48408:179-562(+)